MTEPNEASPLLQTEVNNPATGDGENNITSFPEIGTYTRARDQFKRPVKILTLLLLIVSSLAVTFFVALYICLTEAPLRWYLYTTSASIEALAAFVFVSFLAAIVNTKVTPHILFNIVVDVFISWNLLLWVPELLGGSWPTDGWCESKYGPPNESPINPDCHRWVIALRVLIGISGGIATIVGVTHFVLLLLRLVASWRSRFWERAFALNFPTGEISFTIKVVKFDRTSEHGRSGPSTGAAPTPQDTSRAGPADS